MADLIAQVQQMIMQLGLRCITAFPQKELPHLIAPLVVLHAESEERRRRGMGTYFGKSDMTPCYGQAFTGVVAVEIFVSFVKGGEACEEALQTLLAVLPVQLAKMGLTEVRVKPVSFDADTDCFRCTIFLTFQGYLCRKEEA